MSLNKPMNGAESTIRLRGVSRWYGEVLGINKVDV